MRRFFLASQIDKSVGRYFRHRIISTTYYGSVVTILTTVDRVSKYSAYQRISTMQWHFRRIICKTLTRGRQITYQGFRVLPRVSGSLIFYRIVKIIYMSMNCVCHLLRASLTLHEIRRKIPKLLDASDYVVCVMSYSRISDKNIYCSFLKYVSVCSRQKKKFQTFLMITIGRAC